MEPNLFEDPIWYEDSLVVMVDIGVQIKKKNKIWTKYEPKTSVDNRSIGFHKALQTFQQLPPNELVKVMEQMNNILSKKTILSQKRKNKQIQLNQHGASNSYPTFAQSLIFFNMQQYYKFQSCKVLVYNVK